MRTALSSLFVLLILTTPLAALDGPWIGDVFFYWYTWDYDRELGSWLGGVHNTPLDGYYDSRTLRDNRRSLHSASEWGMTHHFMDYWSPDWKADDGRMREAVVMEAAQSLRAAGYDIWMSYYQDGSNFEMEKFSRNVSEKRDVHQWLRDFAKSEVWPKIDGQPLQLVYSRNGRPKTTLDHRGFRDFLRKRYDDVAALNREWGSTFADFDEIEMTLGAGGHQRAASIEFQYQLWQSEWQELNRLVQKEFALPGMRASFDVGYGAYEGFGYADFSRVFGGPHSYGGIFGPPHDQDVQRFIQSALAKRYGTVFFDHFKNYYFDWDIRVPGMAYLPDPFHFDRFWVGALARKSEAMLHLSWNEWWEGSNLEPCREFGKTYCQKNLFYATLMKLAFPSIRLAGRDAPVAVLLNDWRFTSGAKFHEELYGLIQILRRLGVPFDLVPDDQVTAEQLDRFRLVVAPAYGCGLGHNARRRPIPDVLAGWLKGGNRRLIISGHPSVAELLGLRQIAPTPSDAATGKGDDLNVLVDVGSEGDERFLRSGFSFREPPGGGVPTFRWTPADGNQTVLILPASPHRDHVLRLEGNAIWPNVISVAVNGRPAGSLDIPAGEVAVLARIPAAVVGPDSVVWLGLRHAQLHVPGKKAPQVYKGEARVCNLGLRRLQWSTANVPAGSQKQQYTLPEDKILLAGPVFDPPGQTVRVPVQPRRCLGAPGAKVLSVVTAGATPRDLLVPFGSSEVIYVNGPLSEIELDDYWLPLARRWAGVDFQRFAISEHCMASRLSAGDTEFVVCFNQDIAESRQLKLATATKTIPLSEAVVLARDGRTYQPLEVTTDDVACRASDVLRYYAVYQFAFSPLKIETPELVIQPGQERAFPVRLTNLTSEEVHGHLRAAAVIPTITSQPVQIDLGPGQTKSVPVQIFAAPTVDWGTKTIYFDLAANGRRAVVLRELVVEKPAEVELDNVILDASAPRVELRVPENPHGRTATLTGARLTLGGQTIQLPEIREGGSFAAVLAAADLPAPSRPTLQPARLRIDVSHPHPREVLGREVFLAVKPKDHGAPADATTALAVFNARSKPLEHELLSLAVPHVPNPHSVRTEDGTAVASQVDPSGRVAFLAAMPARSGRAFYVCTSKADVPTDLRCGADGLATGKGTLRVENSHLKITLSEAAGGTVTSLCSVRTGRDYGRRSFGVNYGAFSLHDPGQPRTDSVQYIKEKKTRQESSPGQIELLSGGPVAVIARVTWADERIRVEQTYEFRAYQPYFVVRQKVQPIRLEGQQELVAFNAQFQPQRLTKSFPNFVGAPNDGEQPHFCWRQGAWVPDYATLMAPDGFEESLSLIISGSEGLSGIRQGFWPKLRPNPGKCEIAQIELLAHPAAGCDAEIYVLLHPGHQIVAKQFLADLRVPPRVELIDKPK